MRPLAAVNHDFETMSETLNQAIPKMATPTVAVERTDQTSANREPTKLSFAFLWLFTFAVYARPQDIYPVINPLHLPLVFGICAGLAYLADLISGRARLMWPRELVLVLLLTAWFILGVPFSYWRGGSFEVLIDLWIKVVLSFFLLTQTLTSVGRDRNLLWGIVIGELLATIASIILRGEGRLEEGGRLAGVSLGLLNMNYFGIVVSVTLPYIAVLYVSRRSPLRTGFLIATIGSTLWMLVLTASRGGFLGVIFSMVLTWWFILRGSLRGRIVAALLPMFLIISMVKAPDVFWLRLQTIWGGSQAVTSMTSASAEESTKGREFLLEQSIKYSLQFPVFGVGIGNFPLYNGEFIHRPDAWLGTHNTFTQISSEAGIPALVLFLTLFGTVVRRARRLSKKLAEDEANHELRLLARATLVSAVAFAFGAFFAHLGYEYIFYYVAGIAASLWAISRRSDAASQSADGSAEPRPTPPLPQWSPKWP